MGHPRYPPKAYHGQPNPRRDQMLYASQQRQERRPRNYVVYREDIEMPYESHFGPERRLRRENYYYREPPQERNEPRRREDGHCWCCG